MRPITHALVMAIALAGASTASTQPLAHAGVTDTTRGTVTVVPGAGYAAGWLHRAFFGDHWRHAWTTPIEAAVLDLDTFAGGLKPIKRGGGYQTKSLRFEARDGRQFKFRSLDKDPTRVLPPELQESIAADVVQDQISTSHPYAPFVVAPLLDAVGVINAEPQLVLLPPSPKLGLYLEEFGGLLGILEEHPDTRDDGEPGFGGSDKVESTLDLFARLEKRNDEWPDAHAYLVARLMDIFLGDWDRHTDQWQWARVVEGDRKLWKPIPRDRDQAFSRYDGLLPWVATVAVTQLEGFSEDYPKIADLTWSGRHIDRRFLTSIERPAWDSITRAVVAALTDETIDAAVRRLPAAIYAHDGAMLERTLRARRDGLAEASTEFYDELAKAVDVRASREDEIATIRRVDDDHISIVVADRGDGHLVYGRTFDASETREVRLHLGDGADSVVVLGEVSRSIPVRILGGDGADVLVDRSRVDGYALGVIPFIPHAETATIFYDDGKRTQVELGASAVYRDDDLPAPATELERYEPLVPDYGHDWRFGPWLDYTSDLGVFVGGGPILYEHGFQADPYVYRMSLLAGYATTARTFKAQFTGDFRTVIPGARLGILARASGLEVQNYFGAGNETPRSEGLAGAGYYKVNQRQYSLRPEIGWTVADNLELIVGGAVMHARSDERDGPTIIDGTRPYGYDPLTIASGSIGVRLDTRDVAVNASRGAYIDAGAEYHPRVLDNRSDFSRLHAEARTYLTVDWPRQTTLALRAVASTTIGNDYPFHKAVFLGGVGSLRGYESERFAGDAALAGNAELRVSLIRFNVLFPGIIGVTAAVESGRVYLDSETSDRWHSAYGGGLFVTLVDRPFTLSASAMQSPEKLGIYVVGGFAF